MSRVFVHFKLGCTAMQGNGNFSKCSDCFGAIIYPVYPIAWYNFIPGLQSLTKKIDFWLMMQLDNEY